MNMPTSPLGASARNAYAAYPDTEEGLAVAPGSAAGNNASSFELLEQAYTLINGKSPADVGLPKPGFFTQPATTMMHLGSLGPDKVEADVSNCSILMLKLAQNTRGMTRTQRTVHMQSQVSALQSAAAEMKSAAQSRFTASMIQGGMQILGGLTQALLSSAAAYKTLKANSLTSSGRAMKADARNGAGFRTAPETESIRADGNTLKTDGANAKTYGDTLNSYSQAAGGIMSGAGSIAAAFYTLNADRHDARRSELEAQSKVFETGVQQANDTMQQMMDVIRDVRDKLQSIQQSAIETNRSISRNII